MQQRAAPVKLLGFLLTVDLNTISQRLRGHYVLWFVTFFMRPTLTVFLSSKSVVVPGDEALQVPCRLFHHQPLAAH